MGHVSGRIVGIRQNQGPPIKERQYEKVDYPTEKTKTIREEYKLLSYISREKNTLG